jgi:hypothetical protein
VWTIYIIPDMSPRYATGKMNLDQAIPPWGEKEMAGGLRRASAQAVAPGQGTSAIATSPREVPALMRSATAFVAGVDHHDLARAARR